MKIEINWLYFPGFSTLQRPHWFWFDGSADENDNDDQPLITDHDDDTEDTDDDDLPWQVDGIVLTMDNDTEGIYIVVQRGGGGALADVDNDDDTLTRAKKSRRKKETKVTEEDWLFNKGIYL